MPERNDEGTITFRLRLVKEQAGQRYPDVAVYALNRNHDVIYKAEVDGEGNAALSENVFETAAFIALAPANEALDTVDRDRLVLYRAGQFRKLLR